MPDNSPQAVKRRLALAKVRDKRCYTGVKLHAKAVSKQGIRKPLWEGPESTGPNGGITFSLLSKFLVCRERFRLKVVEGLGEEHKFIKDIEFGNFFHEAEEAYLKKATTPEIALPLALSAMASHRRKLIRQYPNDQSDIDKWYSLAKRQYPLYIKHWATHSVEKGRQSLLEEAAFRVPYKLPSGRQVVLRGKFDAVMLMPLDSQPIMFGDKRFIQNPKVKKKGLGIYVQENKTKGRIDEEGLLATVAGNLQTMLYLVALEQWTKPGSHSLPVPLESAAKLIDALCNHPIGGVLYNVIRRPLSDQYAIKQRKGRQVKGKTVGRESVGQFYDRVEAEMAKDPAHYFMRWKVDLEDGDLETFKTQIFNPILEDLLDWWSWIRVDPFNPWRPRTCREIAQGSGLNEMLEEMSPAQRSIADAIYDGVDQTPMSCPHWQAPFGVYNGMYDGMRGDYFDLLTTGRDYGLVKATTLFPEL